MLNFDCSGTGTKSHRWGFTGYEVETHRIQIISSIMEDMMKYSFHYCWHFKLADCFPVRKAMDKIGRASCRERVYSRV